MKRAVTTMLTAAFVLAPAIALAHSGHGDTSGLMHGLTHPITGIDHVLAMVAVGLLSAHLGGRALWLVPLGFVGVMAVAGALPAASGFPYAAGFVAATAMLHGAGVGLGLLIGLAGATLGRRMLQAGGGAMALFGTAVLAGVL